MADKPEAGFQGLIQRLRDGKMLDHPGVRVHLRRALATGDQAFFLAYLDRNPALLAHANQNIILAEHQNALHPFRPYPSRADVAEHMSGPLKLGWVNEFDDQLGVNLDNLCKPSLVIGRTGSGKTTLLKVMTVQALNLSGRQYNIIILDPQKREYRGLLDRCTSLKIITPEQLRLNPLVVPSFLDTREHIIAVSEVLVSEGYLGQLSLNLIKTVLTELYRQHATPTLLQLRHALYNLRKTMGKSYRYYDLFLNIENRLQAMLESGVFSCSHGVPIDVFRNQDVVIELDGHQTLVVNFLIAFIVRMLYLGNVREGKADSTLRHLVVTEEARGLLQAHRDVSLFGESAFNQDLTRIRAAGIGVIISTQDTQSISPVARSMATIKIAFPFQDGADVQFVADGWGLDEDQRDYLFKLPVCGQAVVRYGGYPDPFVLAVPSIELRNHVDDSEVEQSMADFWSSLQDPPASKDDSADAVKRQGPEVPPHAASLLWHIGNNPFSPVMELYNLPSFSRPKVKAALEWLNANGYVAIEGSRIKPGRPTNFPVITQKGMDYLGIDALPGKGSYEHKLYQHLVCRHLQATGQKAAIEGRTRKSSPKLIDVLAGDVAYEITLHTSNLAENILEDLRAGATEVVIVTRNRTERDMAAAKAADDPYLERVLHQVSFHTIDEFTRDPVKNPGDRRTK